MYAATKPAARPAGARSTTSIRPQLAMVSANFPGNGAMLEQLRKRTNEAHIPLIGLADERAEISSQLAAKYDVCHFKSERQAILETVEKLTTGGLPERTAPPLGVAEQAA